MQSPHVHDAPVESLESNSIHQAVLRPEFFGEEAGVLRADGVDAVVRRWRAIVQGLQPSGDRGQEGEGHREDTKEMPGTA